MTQQIITCSNCGSNHVFIPSKETYFAYKCETCGRVCYTKQPTTKQKNDCMTDKLYLDGVVAKAPKKYCNCSTVMQLKETEFGVIF